MEGEYETAPKFSNGNSLNDLQWSFQGHDYSTSNNMKMVHCYTYNGRPIESRRPIRSIERRYFQWLERPLPTV